MRFKNYLYEGIITAGLPEASVFIFQNYQDKYNKWMKKYHTGAKKPNLLPVIKNVVKKFNSYDNPESKFTIDDLVEYYIKYQLDNFKGINNEVSRRMYIEHYGFDTLPKKYKMKIDKFIH